MIADDLYKKQIELAVITDHNNIKGYKKLKDAVSILKKGWKDSNSIIPSIQLGIEMTCGDVLHVVGIFDESEDAIKNIEDFLNKNLVSEKEVSGVLIIKGSLRTLHMPQEFQFYGFVQPVMVNIFIQ